MELHLGLALMPEIDAGISAELLRILAPKTAPEIPEHERLRVHATVSRFAFLYERIRNAVDYKEDHLLRLNAIARILRRQLVLETDAHAIAKNLVNELIGARYLPNDALPESVVNDVAVVVSKELAVRVSSVAGAKHAAWRIGVLSAEIDERVAEPTRDKGLITFLYERLGDRIGLTGAKESELDVHLQIYIAVARALTKADDTLLSYKLLRAYAPEWMRPDGWIDQPAAMAERLVGIETRIRTSLRHPLGSRFLRAVKPWAVSQRVLVDALDDKPEQANKLLGQSVELDAALRRVTERGYASSKTRLRRGAFRAIIYLLITKMLLAFVIEVPLEQLWYGAVALPALAINLMFPPVLMFIVSLFIRVPGKRNTDRIVRDARLLLSTEGPPETEIRVPLKRRGVTRIVFTSLYALAFLITFGLIALGLLALHFTWVSAVLFLFFLCLVSFFAFRLRLHAREMVVVEEKEGASAAVVDYLSLPVLRSGAWLSTGISRINIFLFIFDFLFEAPFKLFLVILEEWFAFIKEKKEDLE